MKQFNFLLIALCCLQASAQSVNHQITDSRQRPQLIGKITKTGLEHPPFQNWFGDRYNAYRPDSLVTSELAAPLKQHTLTLFMGTWCGDSKREVPKLYRVLEAANFPLDRLTVVAVSGDRETYKQSPGGEQEGLNIHRVPTIILYKDGQEVNRMVESPVESIEADLLAMINGAYTPHYSGVNQLDDWIDRNLPAASPEVIEQLVNELGDQFESPYALGTYSAVSHYAALSEKAILAAKLNVALFPKKAYSWIGLALRQKAAGEDATAMESIQRALELEPNNTQATDLRAQWQGQTDGSGN